MGSETPVNHEKPPCPYIAGFKLAVQPYTPLPPFGGQAYRGVSGLKAFECHADIQKHSQTRFCIKGLEPDGLPGSSSSPELSSSGPYLVIDSVIRGGDGVGPQIVACHWDNDLNTICYVAKIYDPLYYNYWSTDIGLLTDVVWFATRDHSVEAAAYEDLQAYETRHEKESIRGCYPEYFGSFSFKIKLVVDGVTYTRTVPLILMEFLNGSTTMKELIDGKQVPASDDARVYSYVCAVKSYLKLKTAGVSQDDFSPRNILFIGNMESPSLRAVIFDFNTARVFSRTSPPRPPPNIDGITFAADPSSQRDFQDWLPEWFYTDRDKRENEVRRLWYKSCIPFEPSVPAAKNEGSCGTWCHKHWPRTLSKNAAPTFLIPKQQPRVSKRLLGGLRGFPRLKRTPTMLVTSDDGKEPRSRMALRRPRLWRIIKIAFFLTTLHFLYRAFTSYYITNDTICRPHGWKPFSRLSHSAPPRKVYDLTMINTELDWLEIRLNSTWNEVDYFVVVESPRTFTNLPKPLHLKTALANPSSSMARYKSKIIYHEITYPEDFAPKSTWNIEDFQRNAMLTQVFPSLSGPLFPNLHDVLVIADIDEIARPSTLSVLRQCSFPRRLTLSSRFYYYSFQYLHVGEEWPHPQATYYLGANTLLPNDLRVGDGPWWRKYWEMGRLKNAAWHCSSCFETMGEMLTKMKSFSHAGMNQDVFRDRQRMVERVRMGKDLWDRVGEEYERVEGNEDLPGLLRREKERFGYMLDRDGEGAGFRDWGEG
ncbi:hypothetical protein QC762_109810 [Podospora pseudocomata]|uniref:Glycosyltransferase Family 17 n=1 Tax=Podospora pseudocomata TaxID=2093779 RepID=A0ABR0GUF7_9PEZI|nr:hypothetical protein QC762_109810 [Podospora pseudocomata]